MLSQRLVRNCSEATGRLSVCRRISTPNAGLWAADEKLNNPDIFGHFSCFVLQAKCQFAVKDREHHVLELMFQFWVVAVTFIAHKSVGAVDLDPLVAGSNFVEASEDLPSSFERDVRVLSAPNVEQFTLDLRSAGQRVILLASTEGARVNVG